MSVVFNRQVIELSGNGEAYTLTVKAFILLFKKINIMKKLFTLLMLFCMASSYAQVNFIKTVRIGSPIYVVNGKMLFAALDANSQYQLWVSDGTDVGTTLLKSFYTVIGSYHGGNMYQSDNYAGEGLYNPIVFNNELYFFANDPANNHSIDLWKSDGTASGTVHLQDFTSSFNSTFSPSLVSFCVFNSALYFSCGNNGNGAKLWKTNGGVPTVVIDINNGPLAWGPRYMTVFNNALYFTANDGTTGVEIWKSDGTAAGTHLLKDIFPGTPGVENRTSFLYLTIPQFIVSGNFLYFTGYRDLNSNFLNLYRTDGTQTFTIQLNPNIYKELPGIFSHTRQMQEAPYYLPAILGVIPPELRT